MASSLTSAGVTFGGDSTSITSKYYIINQNTEQVFYQSSAPTGWVQLLTSAFDSSAIRVRNSNGSGFGGGQYFTNALSTKFIQGNTNANFSGSLQNHTLTTQQIPAHAHGISYYGPGYTTTGQYAKGLNPSGSLGGTGNTGGGGSHSHGITVNSISGPYSGRWNLAIKYIDVIACKFS